MVVRALQAQIDALTRERDQLHGYYNSAERKIAELKVALGASVKDQKESV